MTGSVGLPIVRYPPGGVVELPSSVRLEVRMESSRLALEMATSDLERLRERGEYRALFELARGMRRNDIAVLAAEMVLIAERSIFLADQKMGPAKRGRGNMAERAIGPAVLKEIRRAFRHVDGAMFDGLLREARETDKPLTREAVRRAGAANAGRPAGRGLRGSSGDYERVTPPHIIEAARRVMGGIDLDPASTFRANKIVGAQRYYTEHEDGLKRAWRGRVWLNPPYSRGLVVAFVERLLARLESGDVTQAVLLTNNSTDTAWWQEAVAAAQAFCLAAGRLNFLDSELRPVGPWAIQGQTILYFDRTAMPAEGTERFRHEFSRHGQVCFPAPTGAS